MPASGPFKVERRKKAVITEKGGNKPSQHPIRNLMGSRRTAVLKGNGWEDYYKQASDKLAEALNLDEMFPGGVREGPQMIRLVREIGEYYRSIDPGYFEQYAGGLDEWVKERTSNPILTAQTLRAYGADPGVRSPLMIQLGSRIYDAARPELEEEVSEAVSRIMRQAVQRSERKYRGEDLAANVLGTAAEPISPAAATLLNLYPDIREAFTGAYSPEAQVPETLVFEREELQPYIRQALAETRYVQATQRLANVETRLARGGDVSEAEAEQLAEEATRAKEVYEEAMQEAPPISELYAPVTTRQLDWTTTGTEALERGSKLTSLGLAGASAAGPRASRLGRLSPYLMAPFYAAGEHADRSERLRGFLRDHVNTFKTYDDDILGKALISNMVVDGQRYPAGTEITPSLQNTLHEHGIDELQVGNPIPTKWILANWGASTLDTIGGVAAAKAGGRSFARAFPVTARAGKKLTDAFKSLSRVSQAGRFLSDMGAATRLSRPAQAAARYFTKARTATGKMRLLSRLAKRSKFWAKVVRGLRFTGKFGSRFLKSIPVVGQLVNIGVNAFDAAFGMTGAGMRESDELLKELWSDQMTQPGWQYQLRSWASIPEAALWDTRRLRTHLQDIGSRHLGYTAQRNQFIRKFRENKAIMEEYADRALPQVRKLLPGLDPKLAMNAAAEIAVHRINTRKGGHTQWRNRSDFEELALSKDSPYLSGLDLTEQQRQQAVRLNRLMGPDAFIATFYFRDDSGPQPRLQLDVAAWNSLKKGVKQGAEIPYGYGTPQYSTAEGGVTDSAADGEEFIGYDDKYAPSVVYTPGEMGKKRSLAKSRKARLDRIRKEEATLAKERAEAREREAWQQRRKEFEQQQAEWKQREAEDIEATRQSYRDVAEARQKARESAAQSEAALKESFWRSLGRLEGSPGPTSAQMAPELPEAVPSPTLSTPRLGSMMSQDYTRQTQPQLDQASPMTENVPTVATVIADLQQKGVFDGGAS